MAQDESAVSALETELALCRFLDSRASLALRIAEDEAARAIEETLGGEDPLAGCVPDTPFTHQEHADYCRAILDGGAVGAGDLVFVQLTDPDHQPALDELRVQGCARSAKVIGFGPHDTLSDGDLRQRNRALARMVRSNGVYLRSTGFSVESAPHDDHRAAHKTSLDAVRRRQRRQKMEDRFDRHYDKHLARGRASFFPWPTRAWAVEAVTAAAWPAATEQLDDFAYRVFGQLLMAAVAAGPFEDPGAVDALEARAARLNELELKEIRLVGRGTDMTIGIADGARWITTRWTDRSGRPYELNLGSREIFTTPDPDTVEGRFEAVRPLMHRFHDQAGHYTASTWDFSGRFVGGELASYESQDAADSPEHARLLDSIFGRGRAATQLGEIGLADSAGLLNRSGVIFQDPILDENTGVHLGFGRSFSDQTGGRGTPTRGRHLDLVVGDLELQVEGVDAGGEVHLLMQAGRWMI